MFPVIGTVQVRTSGPDYEKMKTMVHEKKPVLPAKSLVVMKITKAFSCAPGQEAGN
jgi:predicted pyridoxine 5'-phosphate oxidase superfamily flavin-nucleotide-binding protein